MQTLIDPTNITNFSRTDAQLQTFWLFGAFCAGKNSDYASKCLAKLLAKCGDQTPFEYLRSLGSAAIHNALVAAKIGQYARLSRFVEESIDLDLRAATLQDLMNVFGIGPKTARFFLLHSRPDCECAVLDCHILKFLRENSVDAPQQTPTNQKQYIELEKKFIFIAKLQFPQMSVAQIDLMLWMKYSGRLENDFMEPSFS